MYQKRTKRIYCERVCCCCYYWRWWRRRQRQRWRWKQQRQHLLHISKMNEAKRWKVLFFSALCTMGMLCVCVCCVSMRAYVWMDFILVVFILCYSVRCTKIMRMQQQYLQISICIVVVCIWLLIGARMHSIRTTPSLRLYLPFAFFGHLLSLFSMCMCICIKCDCFIAFFRSFWKKESIIPEKNNNTVLCMSQRTQHIHLFIWCTLCVERLCALFAFHCCDNRKIKCDGYFGLCKWWALIETKHIHIHTPNWTERERKQSNKMFPINGSRCTTKPNLSRNWNKQHTMHIYCQKWTYPKFTAFGIFYFRSKWTN